MFEELGVIRGALIEEPYLFPKEKERGVRGKGGKEADTTSVTWYVAVVLRKWVTFRACSPLLLRGPPVSSRAGHLR